MYIKIYIFLKIMAVILPNEKRASQLVLRKKKAKDKSIWREIRTISFKINHSKLSNR